jgi:hypothetical protein
MLTEYTAGILARLTSVQGNAGEVLSGVDILLEDAADLETQIAKAIDENGMVILIGMPSGDNNGQSKHVANMVMKSTIGVGENPILWRQPGRPVCKEVVDRVMGLLQDFTIAGFQPLRVQRFVQTPDKKRQLYDIEIESQAVLQKTNE